MLTRPSKRMIVSASSRGVSAFVVLLSSVVVTRVLGIEQAGIYLLAFGIVNFLATISRIGLDNTVLKHVSAGLAVSHVGEAIAVSHKAIILVLSASSVTSLTVYLASDLIEQEVFKHKGIAEVLRAISPCIITLALCNIYARCLQGMSRFVTSLLTMNIFAHLLLILMLIYYRPAAAVTVGWIFSASTALALGLGAIIWHSSLNVSNKTGSLSWQQLFNSCMPLWIVVIATAALYWSAQLIAGTYVSAEELALLAISQRLAGTMIFLSNVVNYQVIPRFAALYRQEKTAQMEHLITSTTRMLSLLALPVLLFMMIAPEFLLSIFGEDYRKAAPLLRILALGQFINVITGPTTQLLIMTGHEKEVRNISILIAISTIVSALFVIPYYGITGAAIVSAVNGALNSLIIAARVKRILNIHILAIFFNLVRKSSS